MKFLSFLLLLIMTVQVQALTLGSFSPKGVTINTSLNIGKGKTYYVRSDGGTREQCDGFSDKAYVGPGIGLKCAFISPYSALGIREGNEGVMVGGDTLIIKDGEYMIGYGAPNATVGPQCADSFAWGCTLDSIPSGSPGNPTRILGEGYSTGCKTRPKLWGTQRVSNILNLNESDWVEIQCLEVTDKAECGFGKAGTAYDFGGPTGCARDTFPHGEYGMNGIYALNSDNVYLKDINIHGMASNGASSGKLSNWELHNVDLSYNSQAGWNGDIDGTDITGYMRFYGGTVNWNGCMESATTKGLVLDASCVGQDGGNYSDGLGFNDTGGDWLLKDMEVSYNVQDGVDLLYILDTGRITVDNLYSTGNGGNSLKLGNTKDQNILRDSTLIGNCTAMSAASSFWFDSATCRAGGHPIAVTGDLLVERTTIYASGSGALLLTDRNGHSASIDMYDSIIYINKGYNIGNGQTQEGAFGWNEETNVPSTWGFTNTIIFDTRGYVPTPNLYELNGVALTVNNPCQLSSWNDPVITGCIDPGFTEIPSGTDGPGKWEEILSLTIDPASPLYGKPIGDYR